jgi:predicted chitinase
MSNLKSILKSFHLRDELNPKIWVLPNEKYMGDPKGQTEKMRSKVRNQLLEISNEFIEFLKVDVVVSDIIMIGSLSNYNWSNFSDVDLHILIDFNQFTESNLPLYEELFKLKKTLFNDKHHITIYGYEVELFVQNESESHFSSGVYSVLYDEWITKPKKESVEIDTELIKNKSQQWMDIIDGVIENAKDEPLDDARRMIERYKDKIKKYRTCGLEKNGEYSDENLVFKVLRRNNYIQKLFDFDKKHTDKELSLKEEAVNIGGSFKTDLEGGPSNHSKRAFGNWESDNAWDIFSPPGTVVNSYTNGTVTKVKNTGKNSGKVFGTQVSIKGDNNFPNIFYTHLKNVKLRKGDKVNVGDYIGEISEWVGNEGSEHVHIGLPRGRHLRELLINSDKIFTGSEDTSKEISTNSGINDKITDSLQNLISNKTEFSNVNDDDINKNLFDVEKGSNKIMSEFYNLLKSGKELKNLKGVESTIPVDRNVELIQTGLQFLGILLPKWGVDGKFGPETEKAVKEFQKKYGLSETGVMTNEDLVKLFSILIIKNFGDDNMSAIELEGETPTGKIKLVGSFDSSQKEIISNLINEMNNMGITNPYTQIGILSVISKESNFKSFKENSYCGTSDSRITSVFGNRGEKCKSLKCNDSEFFDCVYGHKSGTKLGNDQPGDGWKYVGRGLNGLTGKANYQKYGNMIGVDLVGKPELVEDPKIASKVAIAFFTKGKSPSSLPNFTNKEDSIKYFADINAGGRSSFGQSTALAASQKFDVDLSIT